MATVAIYRKFDNFLSFGIISFNFTIIQLNIWFALILIQIEFIKWPIIVSKGKKCLAWRKNKDKQLVNGFH